MFVDVLEAVVSNLIYCNIEMFSFILENKRDLLSLQIFYVTQVVLKLVTSCIGVIFAKVLLLK